MRKHFIITFFILSLFSFNCKNNNSADNKTSVLVLGAIHSEHKRNPNYSFDCLFNIIDRFKPDVVGIEIRSEDMNEPDNYLKKSYPPDMIQIKKRYFGKKIVVGFDWLGENLEGKLIPENYWTYMPTKILEREFDKDSSISTINIKKEINIYDSLKMVIFKNGNAIELNTKYDSINYVFYDRFKALTYNTKYEKISNFYTSRDNHIDENMIKIIKKYNNKRIIFVTGVDHKVYAIAAIKKEFNNKIEIIDLKNIINAR